MTPGIQGLLACWGCAILAVNLLKHVHLRNIGWPMEQMTSNYCWIAAGVSLVAQFFFIQNHHV